MGVATMLIPSSGALCIGITVGNSEGCTMFIAARVCETGCNGGVVLLLEQVAAAAAAATAAIAGDDAACAGDSTVWLSARGGSVAVKEERA